LSVRSDDECADSNCVRAGSVPAWCLAWPWYLLGPKVSAKCDDVVCVGGVPGTAEENPCLDLTGALCVLVTQS